jgi:transcriptional regulator GlxA family with amidase domain
VPGLAAMPRRHLCTAAGVTAGMDLALALVEEDYGRERALIVARYMVMFLKRPGGQSQFSAYLAAQMSGKSKIQQAQHGSHPRLKCRKLWVFASFVNDTPWL